MLRHQQAPQVGGEGVCRTWGVGGVTWSARVPIQKVVSIFALFAVRRRLIL